jgi:hypothetical protein
MAFMLKEKINLAIGAQAACLPDCRRQSKKVLITFKIEDNRSFSIRVPQHSALLRVLHAQARRLRAPKVVRLFYFFSS